jgi:hypothetical protein
MIDFPDFKSLVSFSGIHQTNFYDAIMIFPSTSDFDARIKSFGWLGGTTDASRHFTKLCYQVNASLGSIQTAQVRTYGEHYEMPYTKSYGNIMASFYLDNDCLMYKIFNVWMECIYNTKTRTVGYLDDYAGTLYLTLRRPARPTHLRPTLVSFLTEPPSDNEAVIVYDYIYPKEISPLPLNGMSGQTATQFDVTFAYRRSYVEGIGDKTPSDLDDTTPSLKDYVRYVAMRN